MKRQGRCVHNGIGERRNNLLASHQTPVYRRTDLCEFIKHAHKMGLVVKSSIAGKVSQRERRICRYPLQCPVYLDKLKVGFGSPSCYGPECTQVTFGRLCDIIQVLPDAPFSQGFESGFCYQIQHVRCHCGGLNLCNRKRSSIEFCAKVLFRFPGPHEGCLIGHPTRFPIVRHPNRINCSGPRVSA